ncbi:MAG: MBL fold metallo-hydrolase, partial [Oscillospiraceae bacterium]|nr:MBL fold metallo-hydrolase [Oscillospiraceae bacterium]
MQKRFRKLISLLLALGLIFSLPVFGSAQQNTASYMEIRFLDVGQADCALISCDGHYMLIDGGNKADSQLVYSVLQNLAVPKLDIIVATHPHEDHIGGIPAALSYTKADLTLSPVTDFDSDAFRDFYSYAAKNGGGITVPTVGSSYSLGGASVKILGLNAANDPNNASIILKLTHGENSFIFTGDAEREAEQAVLNSPYANELAADLLKVGHHGSESSTTYPFLRAVMPQYAVISVGNENSYGHPTDNT